MVQSTKKRVAAVDALMQSRSIAQAARKAGVTRTTMTRWLQDPDFQRELRAARGRAYAVTMTRLIHLSGKAVTTLEAILRGKVVSKARFLAACKVLEYAAGVRTEDVQQRIDEIETRLERFEGVVE